MKRSPVRRAARFLVGDLAWKLLSLAIAVLLWFVVTSEPELVTFISVPVQYKDMPDGLEVSSEVIETVSLELSGPSGELRAADDNRRYTVILDMSGVQPGERTFTISAGNVKLPRGVELVRAIPSQLRFRFERTVRRTVPVRVRFGPPHPGYEMTDVQVSPPELRIEGPESRVQDVHSVATDPVDLSNVVGTAEFRVTAYLNDPHVRFTSSPRVQVRVQVRAGSDTARGRIK